MPSPTIVLALIVRSTMLLGDDRRTFFGLQAKTTVVNLVAMAMPMQPRQILIISRSLRCDLTTSGQTRQFVRSSDGDYYWHVASQLGCIAYAQRSQDAGSFDLFPKLLRDAGYYCTNNVKEDYNVAPHGKVWDDSSKKAHWRNRAKNQPFFAVFNSTLSHESQIRAQPHKLVHNPEQMDVPKYHPDLPEIRRDWPSTMIS